MRFTLVELEKEQRINIELMREGKIWTDGPDFGRV
jgi:hypothetical protein